MLMIMPNGKLKRQHQASVQNGERKQSKKKRLDKEEKRACENELNVLNLGSFQHAG